MLALAVGGCLVGAELGDAVFGQQLVGALVGSALGISIAWLSSQARKVEGGTPSPRVWPFALAGALGLAVPVVVTSIGDDEGIDTIAALTPLALVVGAVLGAVVGVWIRSRSCQAPLPHAD